MKIAYSQTREAFPLSKKKIIKKTIISSIHNAFIGIFLLTFVIPFLITSNLGNITGTFVLLMLVIVVVCMLIAYWYQVWYFNVYFYDLTDNYLVIKKGPITPREINLPYERVQDVYVDQDLLDRIFGIYDVHLSSATIMSGMEAHIDGLEKVSADGLREKLLAIITNKLGTNKKQNV